MSFSKIKLDNLEDYKKLDDFVNSVEISYDNIDLKYLLRNHLVALLRTREKIGNSEIGLNKVILKRFFKAFFFNLKFWKLKRNYWVFSNAERRKLLGSDNLDRVASIVSENNSSESIFIENPVLISHKSSERDVIISEAVFFIFSYIFGKLFFKSKKIKLDEDVIKFSQINNINLSIYPIIKRFVGQYKFMKFLLFLGFRPQVVFLVYPNGYYGYTYAFKERNVPLIELQHGVIYPLHYAYNCSKDINSNNFKPNYIFVYGLNDKECLQKLEYLNNNNIAVVGSYALWKQFNNKTPVSDYLTDLVNNRRTLLITATTNDLTELYEFFRNYIGNYDDLNVLILPRHRAVDFEDLTNLKVLDTEKTNVFECYQIADFHLTINSTCAFEALFFNIPTFVLDLGKGNIFRSSYNNFKSVNHVNSIDQLHFLIESNKFITPDSSEIEKYYSKNVLNNFKVELGKVLSLYAQDIKK